MQKQQNILLKWVFQLMRGRKGNHDTEINQTSVGSLPISSGGEKGVKNKYYKVRGKEKVD